MHRRSFLKFLGAGVATAVLAVHMKFGDLAPVPETATLTPVWDTDGMVTMSETWMKVDGEVARIVAIEGNVITIERPSRYPFHGVSV